MTARRVAFLFPGQGSQQPGMGRDLAEQFPESRAVFETADRELGRSLTALCFGGSPEDLALTENTQPSILTVSVAVLRALEARGVQPVAAAGHSLGEYSAYVAAGALAFGDAVRTVELRGRFMQEAVPVGEGAMAAILGMAPDRVREVCRTSAGDEIVTAANLNGPKQVVVAGHAAAVQRVMDAAKSAGALRVVPLAVSAPFHCALMRPAAARLEPVLGELGFRDARFPVYSNVDAAAVMRQVAVRDALVRQVTSAVRWQESIEAMLRDGIELFVEVGPGKVLSGLVRGIRKGVPTYQAGDAAGVESVARELVG